MNRLDSTLQRPLAIWAAILVVGLPCAIAILAVSYVPFLEYPARLGVVAELIAGRPDLQATPLLSPAALITRLWSGLSMVAGLDGAGRLLFALSPMLTAAAVAALLLRIGRPPWPALAAIPVAAGPLMVAGQLEGLWGLAAVFAGLAVIAPLSGARRAAAAAAIAAALFFIDLVSMGLFVATAPFIASTADFDLRRAGLTLSGGAAGALVTWGPWYAGNAAQLSCSAPACRWFAMGRAPEVLAKPYVSDLFDQTLMTPGYQWFMIAILVAIIVSVMRAPDDEATPWTLRVPPIIALLAVVILPDRIGHTDGHVTQATIVGLTFALLLAPLTPLGAQRHVWRAVAGVSLVFSLAFALHTQRQQARFAGLSTVIDGLPDDAKVLVLPQKAGDACEQRRASHHMAGWLLAQGHAANLPRLVDPLSPARLDPASPRGALSNDRCGELDQRPRLSIDRLDEARSDDFDFALVIDPLHAGPRGAFVPTIRTAGFVLYTREGHPKGFDLAVLKDALQTVTTERGRTAESAIEASWSVAAETCMTWGGRLPGRPGADRRKTRDWAGLRYEIGRARWENAIGRKRHNLAPPDFACLMAGTPAARTSSQAMTVTVPCSMPAHAVCRLGKKSEPPAEIDEDPTVVEAAGVEHIISPRPMSYGKARRYCAAWKAKPATTYSRAPSRFIATVAAHPAAPWGPMWLGQTFAGVTSPGHPQVCTTSARGYDDCHAVRPFHCVENPKKTSKPRRRRKARGAPPTGGSATSTASR